MLLKRKPRRRNGPQAVRWRERSFRRKNLNELNDKKTQKKRHISAIVSDEPFGDSRPGEKWVSCTESGKWAPRGLHKRGSMLDVYICHDCESN